MPVKINGATSGSVTLAAPATGTDVTLTLPGTSGTLQTAPTAWTDYTPTFTGGTWAVGNGIMFARYSKLGNIVFCKGYFIFGSTTVKDASQSLGITVPFTASETSTPPGGTCTFLDSGTANYVGTLGWSSSTAFLPGAPASANAAQWTGCTATAPFTWATNDLIRWSFVYEAA